jgi:hypothetical protein
MSRRLKNLSVVASEDEKIVSFYPYSEAIMQELEDIT